MTVDELLAAMRAIVDQAKNEDGTERDLTDDEVARYSELEGQLTAARRSAELRARQVAYETPVRSDTAVHTGAAGRRDDTLERAFEAYMRTGVPNQDLVEMRAQSEGVGSEGGYLVPDTFRNKLVERMKAFGGLANVVDSITTGTGAPLSWPTVDDTANVGEIVAEGGTFAAGADLVLGQANLGAYKYMAGGGSSTPLRISVELLQDSAFDVQGLVSRKLGERIARLQAQHIVRGTGAGEPQGIVQGLTPVTTAANTGITYDDLVTWIHSVDPAYRQNARWAFNDAALATLEKVKDSNGDPLWRPITGTIADSPSNGTLMGYPVTIDQAFSNYTANSPTTIFGVFGDLREGYVIRRVKDITLVVNPWSRAAYGQVEFTAWARMDAVQQNTNAYIGLTGHS